MFSRRSPAFVAAACAALAAASCASAAFTIERSADFPPPRASIAMFGVYKNGKLAPEAWAELAPIVASSFGGQCDVAYGAELLRKAPALATAIDSYTQANGVTQDVLEKLEGMTSSEYIVVITVAGKISPPASASPSATATVPPPNMPGGARPRPIRAAQHRGLGSTQGILELSASIYSTKSHASVGLVRMTYGGQSYEEAQREFAARLGSELRGATCGGWSFEKAVDASEIEKLGT